MDVVTLSQINFENKDQVVLYICEMQGQLSDGFWENSFVDPELWTAIVAVRPDNPGLNFQTYSNPPQLCNDELIGYIGDRMINWVRKVRAFPHLWSQLGEHWNWETAENVANESIKWFGVDEKESILKIKEVKYDVVSLRADLTRMSEILRMRSVP
jgi:hypothetical protein